MPDKMLVKYIRDSDNKKIGAVIALDRNRIGWSVLHDDDMDLDTGGRYFLWNDKQAIGRAVSRASMGYDYWKEVFDQKIKKRFGCIPEVSAYGIDPVGQEFPKLSMVMAEVRKMKFRAESYFKGGL